MSAFTRLYLRWCERSLREHRHRAAYHERARQTHQQAADHHRQQATHYEAECARLRARMQTVEPLGKRVEV